MPEHVQYEDDDLFNPETHHEHSDVPVSPLLWSLAIFIVFGFVTYFAIKFMFDQFSAAESKRMDPPATQVARPEDASVPKNQPLLQPFKLDEVVPPNQGTEGVNLAKVRAHEEQLLHHYSWVDKQKGVVRVPIEKAKEMLLTKGGPPASSPAEPAPSPAPATTAAPTTAGAQQ